MEARTTKYRIYAIHSRQRVLYSYEAFYKYPNLLNRDTHPNAKVAKIIGITGMKLRCTQ